MELWTQWNEYNSKDKQDIEKNSVDMQRPTLLDWPGND